MTPLQLGAMVSAIANGGTLYYLQHPTTPEEVANFQPRVKRQLDIAPIIPEISDGMAGAVQYGTARSLRVNFNEEEILGKTGTCSHAGTRYGWFASYANTNVGRIVVVVFLQGGRPTFGPKAAEIAGRMYRNLYDHNFFVAGHGTPSDEATVKTVSTNSLSNAHLKNQDAAPAAPRFFGCAILVRARCVPRPLTISNPRLPFLPADNPLRTSAAKARPGPQNRGGKLTSGLEQFQAYDPRFARALVGLRDHGCFLTPRYPDEVQGACRTLALCSVVALTAVSIFSARWRGIPIVRLTVSYHYSTMFCRSVRRNLFGDRLGSRKTER